MNLADSAVLKRFLESHQLSARKSLGQHFLCSTRVVDRIVAAASPAAGILEIGPGPGLLTGPLSEVCEKLIALEIDERMPPALLESAPKADVRLVDALKSDLSLILEELPRPRSVVSNLPYYITGALLQKVAEARKYLDRAVLMMQAEVADRILAEPGDSARGSLSVYLQSQFKMSKVVSAPAGAFMPPPKVDSVVLLFEPIPSPVPEALEKLYYRAVRHAFDQPRKTLANNLRKAGYAPVRVEQGLKDLPEGVRPHMLSIPEWAVLAAALSET